MKAAAKIAKRECKYLSDIAKTQLAISLLKEVEKNLLELQRRYYRGEKINVY